MFPRQGPGRGSCSRRVAHAAAPLPARGTALYAWLPRSGMPYPQRAEALAVNIREDGLLRLPPLALHTSAESRTDGGHLGSEQLEEKRAFNWRRGFRVRAGHLPVVAREHHHLVACWKRLRQRAPASHVGLPCQHEDEVGCLRHGLGDVTTSSCPWPGAQS